MKAIKVFSILGIIAMSLVLVYGFTKGDFFKEGSRLLAMPWGIVSMVDLYTGFILFSGWIIFREKSIIRSVVWVIFYDGAWIFHCERLHSCRCTDEPWKLAKFLDGEAVRSPIMILIIRSQF